MKLGLLIFLLLLSAKQLLCEPLPIKIYSANCQFVTKDVACYVDSSGNADFKSIKSKEFNVTYPIFYKQVNENPGNKAYWLRFFIQNNSDSSLRLNLYCGTLDFIDMFCTSAGRPLTVIRDGTLRPHDNHLSFEEKMAGTLPLTLSPLQQEEVFLCLRQRTQEFTFGGIEIYDQNAFYSSFFNDYEDSRYFTVFQILFQGFLLCQILYVLFQWIIIRHREYFYYFFYLLIISLYFLSKYESLYGIELLFTRQPLLQVYFDKTLLIIPYFLYFRFIRSFLDIPSNYKRLNRWIIAIEYSLLAYAVFDFVLIFTTFNQRLQGEIFLFVILVVFTLATSFIIFLFRKRQALIYYVLTGSLFVGLGNILGLIFTFLSENENVNLGFHNMLLFSQIGIILEISCFTAGLGYKSHAAEKEKIRSQKKLIEQLKANEILQSKMQNIRNSIAQDLHDEIGSTLSSISILSNLILKEKQDNKTDEMISEIKDSSITLMEKMDDIIWSINPKNDSLANLLLRIKRFASNLFEARNINYNITIQEHVSQVKFPMETRQHIYLILKESINNLIKYSQATSAVIDVSYDQCMFEIHIKDNGVGFEMANNFDGNGLLSMKNRAAIIDADFAILTSPEAGTEIILKVKIK